MTYNLTNYTTDPTLFSFVRAANQTTEGAFILLFLAALMIIITMSLIRHGAGTAISTGLFVSSLAGLLLTLVGFVDVTFLPYFVLPLAMAVVGVFIANRNGGG